MAGREYADDSANANEDGRLIVTTKSGYKQQRARQNTHASVNLGGRDESAREYGNNSPSTDENGHDEGSSVNKIIKKSLRKRMFEDEEEDKGTDDNNEELECDDENNQQKTG